MPTWISPFMKQTYLVSSVLLSVMGQGMGTGYISCLIPALRQPASDIRLSLAAESWLASLFGPAVLAGIIFACSVMDSYGRRRTYLVSSVPAILGWLAMYLAKDYSTLIIGRTLTGITAGAISAVAPVAIGEYTSPKYRGLFLNLKTFGICMGSTIVHLMGNFFHWKTIALIAMIPHVISIIIALTWPESPSWLALKKKFKTSEKSFFWLRGNSNDSKWEYRELIKAQSENQNTTKGFNISKQLRNFKRKDFVKPLCILSTAMILFEACGRHIFPTYALQIIGAVVDSKTEPYYQTLCIDLIITASTMFSSVLVKSLKRRTVLFATGFSAVFFLFLACLHLLLVSKGVLSKDYPWIGICLFILYFVLANLGCTPIPLVLQGEIFPLKYKAAATAYTGIILSTIIMIVLQVTPYMLSELKVYGTFMVFGSVMFLTLLILYFVLPETKDRTLQEIEDYFNYGKFKNDVKRNNEEEVKMIGVDDDEKL